MKRYLYLLLIPVFAFTSPSRMMKAPDDKKCIDCHATVVQGNVTHKPMTQGCETCHKSNGQPHPQADVKGFDLVKEMPDLCYTCHTPLNTKKKVHAPVNNGKCLLCHTPHNSVNASLMKDSPVGKICLECHDDLGLDEITNKHKPVTEGKCQECHDPHQSDADKLLRLEGQDLCYKCHPEKKEALALKSVHPPFRNKCVICHQPHGSKIDRMLTQKLPDLCYGCHDELQADVEKAPFRHKAIEEGKACVNCHTPHSSPNDSLLKSSPMGNICISCHDLKLTGKKVVHGAVTAGKCVECHDPHKSDDKNLVRAPKPDLCIKCHEKQKEQLGMAFTHPPFKNNCSICHNAHSSDELHLLTKKTEELCVGCHDDFEEPLAKSAVVHQPLKDEKSCTNCHSPHASQFEKFLLADQKSLCLGCHDKNIKSGNRTLANIKQVLQKNKYVHGAITKNGCTGCHNPHFSDNANLLTGKFSTEFYTTGVKDSFALCFSCHDSQLLLAANTSTATSFRNGDKNLHFLHVNKTKGRNCSVCHEIHAAVNKHLLKDKIVFGDWTMKLKYTELENGGTCQTGCHDEKTYRR